MFTLTGGMRYIDLNYLGTPKVIATAILDGPDGVTLVDPGPSTTLSSLEAQLRSAGIGFADVRTLLLTHIHLDHAGVSGTLLRRQPGLQVYVHQRGAPHMVDPAKLLESAGRLYGADMGRVWGEFLPVPAENVHTLEGGERLHVAGRTLEVAYTPGHASHHVSFFDRDSGIAFCGDVAGIHITGGFLMPPTPPPDIDLQKWQESLDRIGAWRPATLFLTHFGPIESPSAHVAALRDRLVRVAELGKAALESGGSTAEQTERFRQTILAEARKELPEADMRSLELAVPLDHCFLGLARYWTKRAGK
jgi:glyoxylase-like metal-dependent hydrolase (beta-lactamase superfamily II)